MNNFYIKTKNGEFLPIEISSYLTKDFDGKLIVARVGSDDHIASVKDLDETCESFKQADVISNLKDSSIIVTPYQIDIDLFNEKEIEDKKLCLQITSGEDISSLTESLRNMYKKLRKKFKTVVLPIPLTLKEYRKVRDTLKRSKIRRERRGRARG